MQCKGHRFLACARLERDEYCEAVIRTVFAPSQAGVTFDDKAVVLQCAEIREAGKIGSKLRTDSISKPRILSFENGPTCGFIYRL
jgi:hypothetical protein